MVEPRWRLRLLSTLSALPRGQIPITIRVPSRTRSFAVKRVRAALRSLRTSCPGVLGALIDLDRVYFRRKYRHHPMAKSTMAK
jgi:hypothetical protein